MACPEPGLLQRPSPRLGRLASQAISHYRMIQPGDRLLVGVSGGKDSLSLLHVLLDFQRRAPIPFDLAAVTVDPQSADFDPGPLRDYIPQLGIPYFYMQKPIVKIAEQHMDKPSFCSFCSRLRRGTLYECARREGYNVLVLDHHLDDMAESFLMSAFHNGELRTMKAHYRIKDGDLRVIRPFVYVRERQTRAFAESAGLPVIADNCPACFARPTERARMKQILAMQETNQPQLFQNLLRTMRPLMQDGDPLTGQRPEA